MSEWFKKYKKIFISIGVTIGGIFTYLLFNDRRNNKATKHVSEHTKGLQNSVDRQSSAIETSDRLTEGTREEGDIISELVESEQATSNGLDKLESNLTGNKSNLENLGDSIDDLAKFIDENKQTK